MIFEKPKDVRYTDMAIWVDENAYTDSCDDMTLYKYIYLLVEMLARKAKMFEKLFYYEDFSIYATCYLYNRVIKSRNKDKSKHIDSILNYIKSSLFGLKKNYEKETFPQHNRMEKGHDVDWADMIGIFRTTNDYRGCEYTMGINDISKCVWETCKRTPYATSGDILLDIYTSVLLTILNQVTFSNVTLRDITNSVNGWNLSDHAICKLFTQENPVDSVVLFHIPEYMRNYILFLSNRSKKSLARDLSQTVQNWEPSDSVIMNLLKDQVENYLGSSHED